MSQFLQKIKRNIKEKWVHDESSLKELMVDELLKGHRKKITKIK